MNQITADRFLEATGNVPVQDNLERCNCPDAGNFMHRSCGWCGHDLPVFLCPICFFIANGSTPPPDAREHLDGLLRSAGRKVFGMRDSVGEWFGRFSSIAARDGSEKYQARARALLAAFEWFAEISRPR